MPITRRQFELGIDDETEGLMVKIYDFLEGHRDVAFNREEVAKEAGVKDIHYGRLTSALGALQSVGVLQSRFAATDTYYAFDEEVNKSTWQLKTTAV